MGDRTYLAALGDCSIGNQRAAGGVKKPNLLAQLVHDGNAGRGGGDDGRESMKEKRLTKGLHV